MKKIAIFGTGSALKDLLSLVPDGVVVVGLGDNNESVQGSTVEGYVVHAATQFARLDCDRFIIAARSVDPIRQQLQTLGVAADKILAYYPSYSEELKRVVNADIVALNAEFGLGIPEAGIATMYLWPESGAERPSSPVDDFVRRQSFKLAAARINDLPIAGDIAELGVYKGEQAAELNRMFPQRKLHLFDTFEGFHAADLPAEKTGGFSGAARGDFQDTSVELVRKKMQGPEQVVFHQGYFPDSTAGVEGVFALVSLDVDLYAPTKAGLEWFYPRLAKGGYIFVHDYNNRRYMGVRSAVDEFIANSGACLMPLPDFAGSIVILK